MKKTIRKIGAVILVICLCVSCALVLGGCNSKSEMIGGDKAIELAIEHFRLKAEECTFVRAERDGRKYEIEFVCDKKEYEAEIDAYTGEILEASVESVFD